MLFFEGLRRHPTRDETLCEAVGPPRTSCQRPRCSPRSNWWAKKSRNCSCSHTISGSAQRHPFWGRMMKSHTGRCSENGTHFVPFFPVSRGDSRVAVVPVPARSRTPVPAGAAPEPGRHQQCDIGLAAVVQVALDAASSEPPCHWATHAQGHPDRRAFRAVGSPYQRVSRLQGFFFVQGFHALGITLR